MRPDHDTLKRINCPVCGRLCLRVTAETMGTLEVKCPRPRCKKLSYIKLPDDLTKPLHPDMKSSKVSPT